MIIDIMDLNFEELNLTESYDTARERRARAIYNNEYVKIQSVEEKEEKNYKVSAYVEGYYDKYKVILNINNNTVQTCSCTCEDNNKGNICKHILATCMEAIDPHYPTTKEGREKFFELQRKKQEEIERLREQILEEEKRKREYKEKYAYALSAINRYKKEEQMSNIENFNNNFNVKDLYEESIINRLSHNSNAPALATSIRLEPQVEIARDSSLNITFKIGQTTMYVLKDVVELYDSFCKEETIQYGKKLKFIAKRANFCEDDHKLLDFILEYGSILKYSNQINEDSYYYYYRKPTSTKTIKIYEDKIDSFFEIIKSRPTQFSGYTIDKCVYTFSNENIDILLNMEKDENTQDYILKINIHNYEYITSNKYIYILYNQKIYSLEKENNENLPDILDMFKYNNEMLIPQDKFKEFSAYVLPKAEDYMSLDNLPAEVAKEGVLVNKLATKMYLDLDDKENIILEPKFCYSNYEFNILDKNYKKVCSR